MRRDTKIMSHGNINQVELKDPRYILIMDDMGNPGMGGNDSFLLGGYVLERKQVPVIESLWRDVKKELCGDENVELKWKHFFGFERNNPLLERNRSVRRQLAHMVLEKIFQGPIIYPLICICPSKSKIHPDFMVETRKGNLKLPALWIEPIASFALIFLKQRQSDGEVWCDKLGSSQEEAAWNTRLKKLQERVPDLLCIKDSICFLDSHKNEVIQVAEFVAGVVWRAAQDDDDYIKSLLDKYGHEATRNGLGIIKIKIPF